MQITKTFLPAQVLVESKEDYSKARNFIVDKGFAVIGDEPNAQDFPCLLNFKYDLGIKTAECAMQL